MTGRGVTTLAAVLAAHMPSVDRSDGTFFCPKCDVAVDDYEAFGAHLTEAIAAEGLSVIELPRPGSNPGGLSWNAGDDSVFYTRDDSERPIAVVVLETGAGEAQIVYPDSPRALAAALVAAAEAARS
jgi:hypothetical protein